MFLSAVSTRALSFSWLAAGKKARQRKLVLLSLRSFAELRSYDEALEAERQKTRPRVLITWNVNSLRSLLAKEEKPLTGLLQKFDPCILCMQEVKLQKAAVRGAEDLLQRFEFHKFHLSTARKGYSGVAVFSKESPNDCFTGFAPGISVPDDEGRLMTLVYNDFTLVNVYTPNAGVALQRLTYRTNVWDKAFIEHLKVLRSRYSQPLIVCGDLNVARTAIDLHDPINSERSAGFTIEERNDFELLLSEIGLVDSFRALNGDARGQYTYWSYRARARERNKGWRIDYFLVDASLAHTDAMECKILGEIFGSDHAPLMLTLPRDLSV
ncbi:hypothetical protein CCYA_CCYA09G2687 [Cyanidiococcus yangmingshanensis]|nr:hypothetical protein CCYA_CCYA09G2687 [Cyanidiococcus yangmingshanensis]